MANNKAKVSHLAKSAYDSPYSRSGAPAGPHPTGDPYAPLRVSTIAKLEAMGYDPKTMIERGVLWAKDQDPFGHVKQSRFMHFLGLGFHRTMESYDEFLSETEYDDMIFSGTVIPVVRKFKLDLRRQVRYPDSQAIVVEMKGSVTFINPKTGRPIDVCTLSDGWRKVYNSSVQKVEHAQTLKQRWDAKRSRVKTKILSKI